MDQFESWYARGKLTIHLDEDGDLEACYEREREGEEHSQEMAEELALACGIELYAEHELVRTLGGDCGELACAIWKIHENGMCTYDLAVAEEYQSSDVCSEGVRASLMDFRDMEGLVDAMRLRIVSPRVAKMVQRKFKWNIVEEDGTLYAHPN